MLKTIRDNFCLCTATCPFTKNNWIENHHPRRRQAAFLHIGNNLVLNVERLLARRNTLTSVCILIMDRFAKLYFCECEFGPLHLLSRLDEVCYTNVEAGEVSKGGLTRM